MFWGSPGSKGIILILGFRTCQGLRCPDTSCASPWQRWGVGAWGEWKRWGVSTFQVDLAAESFFFSFWRVSQLPWIPPNPHPYSFEGSGFPGAHSGKRYSRVKPGSSFLWPKQMSHFVTVGGIKAVRSKPASLSLLFWLDIDSLPLILFVFLNPGSDRVPGDGNSCVLLFFCCVFLFVSAVLLFFWLLRQLTDIAIWKSPPSCHAAQNRTKHFPGPLEYIWLLF